VSSFLKSFKHKLIILLRGLFKKLESLDFYGGAKKSISGRRHDEMTTMTEYHALVDVLRQRAFSGSLFELGGAYKHVIG